MNENVVFSAPSVSQRAYIYALKNRRNIQLPLVAEFKKRIDYVYERLCNIPTMSSLPPSGTFYLFVNINKTGLSSEEVSRIIFEKAHVITIPGTAFGTNGEGYIRLACTLNTDVLKDAFDRIEKLNFL